MKLPILVIIILSTAACSKKTAANYPHCLKLRLGMTREELMKIMGPPDETIPYVEGKSLPHLKGRTAYEWANPGSMPGPNHVSVEDESGQVASVRCSDSVISASVFVEPPAPSPAAVQAVEPAPVKSAAAPLAPQGVVGTGAPGQALTEGLARPDARPSIIATDTSFNYWTLEGLKALRPKLGAAACLVGAEAYFSPGSNDFDGHHAAGVIYRFLYAGSEHNVDSFRAPFQPQEAGIIETYVKSSAIGEIGGRQWSPCIADLPVTLEAAGKIARGAGFPPETGSAPILFILNRFEERCTRKGAFKGACWYPTSALFSQITGADLRSVAPPGRTVWVIGTPIGRHEFFFISIDARTGGVIEKGTHSM